jgi:hypothetical protein
MGLRCYRWFSKILPRFVAFPGNAAWEIFVSNAGSTTLFSCASRRGQRGGGKAKALIYTIILVAAIYAAVKLVPPYAAQYQLSDKMQEEARFAVVNREPEEKIRANIFKVAQDLDIPIKAEDIKIVANEHTVRISIDYTVPVDLLLFHVDLHFTPSSRNDSLT